MNELPAYCFTPAIRHDIRLLILGSLPGRLSLEKQQYYGHPRNQFWRLLGELVGSDLPSLPYHDRLEHLNRHGIGLWDVVASAVRPGSLDQHMRLIIPNRLDELIKGLVSLEAIGFNGSMASRLGKRQIASVAAERRLHLIDLPSSSPANTIAYAAKVEAWGRMSPYLQRMDDKRQ